MLPAFDLLLAFILLDFVDLFDPTAGNVYEWAYLVRAKFIDA